LKTYADIVARARELHAGGALPTRLWTLPLICDHLAKAMTGSTGALGPGPARELSSFPRRVAGRILVLTFGYIPKGVESPQRVLPRVDITWDDAIASLDAAVALCQQESRSGQSWIRHPLIGFSDAPTWERFHIVHARHHFGCLRVPRRPASRDRH
jgi:hypothetical protein